MYCSLSKDRTHNSYGTQVRPSNRQANQPLPGDDTIDVVNRYQCRAGLIHEQSHEVDEVGLGDLTVVGQGRAAEGAVSALGTARSK